jgi:hypothetical protein
MRYTSIKSKMFNEMKDAEHFINTTPIKVENVVANSGGVLLLYRKEKLRWEV